MRCYFAPFDPKDFKYFEAKLKSLEETTGLPPNLAYPKTDTTNGQVSAYYIAEETANRFPEFLKEFPVGEWLECP